MRRADRRDGRRDEAIDTNPLTPPNTLTHPPNPHIPSNPRTRPMCSGFPHVISRIAVVVECRPQSREIKSKSKSKFSRLVVPRSAQRAAATAQEADSCTHAVMQSAGIEVLRPGRWCPRP